MKTTIEAALKDALRAKDSVAIGTIRLILAGLKDREIAARGKAKLDNPASDTAQIISLMRSMIKQRNDSITIFKKGDRLDLVAKEEAEIAVIERFLPKAMSREEMEQAVIYCIQKSGAESLRGMGKVMTMLREKHADRMDFAQAADIVKQILSA